MESLFPILCIISLLICLVLFFFIPNIMKPVQVFEESRKMYKFISGRFLIDHYKRIPNLVMLYIKKLYLSYSLQILEILSSFDPSFLTWERIRVHIDKEIPRHSIGISSVKKLSNEMNTLMRQTIRQEEVSTKLQPFIQQELIRIYPNTIPFITILQSIQTIQSSNQFHQELPRLKTILQKGIPFIDPMILAPLIIYISIHVQ